MMHAALRLVLICCLVAAAPLPAAAFGADSSDDPLDPADTTRVRVRLLDNSTVRTASLDVESGSLQVRLRASGAPLLTLRPHHGTATVVAEDGELRFETDAQGLMASELYLTPTAGTRWSLTAPQTGTRTYTGALYVGLDDPALLLINAAPLDDYVASVVASEYGFGDVAGNKAMAIVARTYALQAAAKFDGNYDHVDHTASQVYQGVEAVTGPSRRATHETRGQILTYQNRPIEAVYFSSSGGHTANNEDVWDAKGPLPYLRGKPDPYDRASPHHRWRVSIDRDALLQGLSRHYSFDVQGFVPGPADESGRRLYVELLRPNGSKHRVQANEFRIRVNQSIRGSSLKSTWFDARRRGDSYVFTGRGFGHGVGLSQWGAHEMASRGKSYRDILTFYYTGARIARMDGSKIAPPAPPVAAEEVDTEEETSRRRIGW